MRCYWWNRWYHRRLREIDIIGLFPVIAQKAIERYDGPDQNKKANKAIELHKQLPGNEHWRCECSLEK